jgi:hypothetical protein
MVPVTTPVPPTATPARTPTVAVSGTPTSVASPTASATPDSVTLTRYWLGRTVAHPGDTVSVNYAIQNGTGKQTQLALGISMKSSSSPSWSSGFADPSHDVTAMVGPGSSTHERFFTLPSGLASGTYDVAWGLRDAAGRQVSVASESAALRVVK